MHLGSDAVQVFVRVYVIIGFVVVILMLTYAVRLLQKHDDKVALIKELLEDQRNRDLANRGLLVAEPGRDQDDPRRKEHRPDVTG